MLPSPPRSLAPLDANAFSNYLSPYNALRVAKGYAWAALIVWENPETAEP